MRETQASENREEGAHRLSWGLQCPHFFESTSSEPQQNKTSTTLASRRLFHTQGSCFCPLPSIVPQNSLEKYKAARALQGGDSQAFPSEAGAVQDCTRSP